MRILIVILAIVASSANACVLTEEYKTVRPEAYKSIHSSYYACRKSTTDAAYWWSVAECVEEYGIDSGTRCKHVNISGAMKPPMLEHCEKLKPTAEQAFEYIDRIVEERGFKKCLLKPKK